MNGMASSPRGNYDDVKSVKFCAVSVLTLSCHQAIENDRGVLLLVSLGCSQDHKLVLDGRAVQVVERHYLRHGQGKRVVGGSALI